MPRILIVDDSEVNCHALVRLFKHSGYEAEAQLNGWQALAALPDLKPDVLVLDIMMPGMDGLDVLAAIRSDPQFATLIVLMYSALADPVTRLRAENLGAQGFLIKGTSFKELRQAIELMIEGSPNQ